MKLLIAAEDAQIPLLSAMLLGACSAKLVRVVRTRTVAAALGPTALFPVRLRRPVAVVLCATELVLGIGLIVTAGRLGRGEPATAVRLLVAVLFLVATCALVELRATRPDLGCGCFGEYSTAPVSVRTLARSALLAASALSTIGLAPIQPLRAGLPVATVLAILAAEFALIGALSPELGEGLVRLGYTEPCELRLLPAERTLAALRKSSAWRRHAGIITADVPADVWRELCWRYVVFPGRFLDREIEVVFAVYLKQRRPPIRAAVVDSATGEVLVWPATGRPGRISQPAPGVAPGRAPGPEPAPGLAPDRAPGPAPEPAPGAAPVLAGELAPGRANRPAPVAAPAAAQLPADPGPPGRAVAAGPAIGAAPGSRGSSLPFSRDF